MIKQRFNKKLFGILCGIGAAVCYGTNPLGALLYNEGMTPASVLTWRFGLAWIIIAIIMIVRGSKSRKPGCLRTKESLKVTGKEFRALTGLGLLFLASSLTLYMSFTMMDVGVASTILFVYPVVTAAIMTIFFKERLTWSTSISILLSFIGVMLLYWTPGGGTLSLLGVILVLVSAITYSVYIIVMDKAALKMSSFKINFYVLIYCALGNFIYAMTAGGGMTMPQSMAGWGVVVWLAVVPAILALVMMVYAAKYLGSTATAILGALEPLTAVMIGLFLFSEPFSMRLAIGIMLIFAAVIIIALRKTKTQ